MELFVELLLHNVDDFVYKNVVEKLLCTFKISKKEKGSFRYSALNVVQIGKVFIDQNSYTSSFKAVQLCMERTSQKDEELKIEEESKLRSISGQLKHLKLVQILRLTAVESAILEKNPKVKNLVEISFSS